MPVVPAALWSAGLVCAVIGLSLGRGRGRTRAPAAIPPVLRLAAGIPWPVAATRRVSRAADAVDIAHAGLAAHLDAAGIARMRLGLATAGLVPAGFLALVAPPALVVAPLLAGLGAALPGRWIARRRRARRRAILRELPDLLDLLGICIEAGMALDPALHVAGARLGGTLGEEVGAVLRDLSLGAPRRAAYEALVSRTGAPEITRTVAALLQAEELGAPLSRALQGQAEALRAARRQDSREVAARAAPKIQLIVAMVMVPAVLMLVLGVLVIELSRQLGAVVG